MTVRKMGDDNFIILDHRRRIDQLRAKRSVNFGPGQSLKRGCRLPERQEQEFRVIGAASREQERAEIAHCVQTLAKELLLNISRVFAEFCLWSNSLPNTDNHGVAHVAACDVEPSAKSFLPGLRSILFSATT